MPISAAAMEGIREHGLRWRRELSFDGCLKHLADEDKLVLGDCLLIRETVVRKLTAFQGRLDRRIEWCVDLYDALTSRIEDIGECADDPDDLKSALNDLYDTLDFYRICVVG